MSKLDRREILSRVAAGTITPEDAATQLDAITSAEKAAEPTIRTVRVVRRLGVLDIIGDPTVRDAVAEGPHQARVEGDAMVLEGDSAVNIGGGFFFGIGQKDGTEKLTVRLNPSLALDLQMQAGSCRVRGVEGPIHAEIQAGSATIDGFKSALDVSVQAGSLRASGCLDGGESHISCDAGSVSLNLERGSSVRISTRATMGKVELAGVGVAGGRGSHETIVGAGAGSLAIDANMGTVRVSANQ